MNSDFMPLKIDAFKEASAKRKISFSVPVSSFPRVLEIIPDSSSELRVFLVFGIDEDKESYVDLNLEGTLTLTCQRCLEAMSFEISVNHRLRPVAAKDYLELDLVGEVEPILMEEDGSINILEMVEEELLLALPISPTHPLEACKASFQEAEVFVEKQETRKPFAELAGLLNKN